MNYDNVLNAWAGGDWYSNAVFARFIDNQQNDPACQLAYDMGYETSPFDNPYCVGGLAWAIAEYYHAVGIENS